MAAEGNHATRRAALAEQLRRRPEDPDLMQELAQLEAADGRLEQAETLLRKAVGLGPRADTLEWLGAVLNRRGRFREALPCFREALDLEPGRGSAWNSAGEALGNLGRLDEAVEAFARAIRHQPALAQAHYNLGLVLRAQGRMEQALGPLARAAEIKPDFAEALQALGGLLQSLGRYGAAVRCFRQLARLRPDDPVAHTSLGAALQMSGDLEAARAAYEDALRAGPGFPDAHSNLGICWQGLREPDKAEACFRRALELDPDHQGALGGLAANLDRRGRYAEGYGLLEDRLQPERADPELLITAAQLLRHLGRSDDAVRLLEETLARSPALGAANRERLHFNLGDALDDIGRYDEAYDHYRAGNRLKPIRFDRDEYRRDVADLLQVFAPGWQARLPRADLETEAPLFVVGMPRSGTTLVEQILAAHPRVAGAGELTDLGQAAMDLAPGEGPRFPRALLRADREAMLRAAEAYLARIRTLAGEAERVVDKTPANHLFIGFIELLFPRARVIHCVRHPLDTALSCYFQNFSGQGIPFSYKLGDIAHYYNGYLATMAHWRAHSRLKLHEVVYEELVADLEGESRRLVAFTGLDWDPACLEFHKLDRLVATASHAQVRRPLYHSSVGRHWHYRAHLGPLLEALDWNAWRDSGFQARMPAEPETPEAG